MQYHCTGSPDAPPSDSSEHSRTEAAARQYAESRKAMVLQLVSPSDENNHHKTGAAKVNRARPSFGHENGNGNGGGGGRAPKKALARVVEALRSLFLPVGYPSSVTPDYLAFQSWDTAQAMCSYLRGILATQAILDGVGVGDASKVCSAFFFFSASIS